VVVLNLFVEYLPQVISETFTLSLLTAVLLKAVLEAVVAAKNRVKARFRQASTPAGKVVAAVMLWVVLFASKFPVLEVVALVFGDRVSPRRLLLGDRVDPCPAALTGGCPPPTPKPPPARGPPGLRLRLAAQRDASQRQQSSQTACA
jgi:hypothetical protein